MGEVLGREPRRDVSSSLLLLQQGMLMLPLKNTECVTLGGMNSGGSGGELGNRSSTAT